METRNERVGTKPGRIRERPPSILVVACTPYGNACNNERRGDEARAVGWACPAGCVCLALGVRRRIARPGGGWKRAGVHDVQITPKKGDRLPVPHLRRGGRWRDISRPGTSRVIWRSRRQSSRTTPRQTHPAYSPEARQRRLEKPASSPVSRFHFLRVRKTEWKRGMSGRESGPDAASKDGLSFSLLLAPPVETQATTRCEETRLGP